MGFICSILIGIVAGFIASKIMKGKGMGFILNLIVGVVGGVLGGSVFRLLGLEWNGIIGSLITSTIGAIILLWLLSLIQKKN